jgi:hypothetical protein
MTRGDVFRKMTDKELAEIIPDFCDVCEKVFGDCVRCDFPGCDCFSAREKWLQQQVDKNKI